tara:strand:+ start:3747 stop:8138 length:4392 start_codon:yes stop_codon:yes gene_type:complete
MDRESPSGKENPNSSRLTLVLVLIFASPLLLPFTYASGEPRFESSDFGVLDELSDMLEERGSFLDSNSVSPLADARIDAVRDSVKSSDPSSSISEVGPSIDGLSMTSSSPPDPEHPAPYDLLLTGGNNPGMVDNIWQTLFNITDYVIWTQYIDENGQINEKYEVVSFSASLFSILNTDTEALLHAVDVDGDGDDDIQVGLTVDVSLIGGWGVEGGTLWIEPGIQFTVRDIGNSASDPDWGGMKSLHVSLIKAFSYSASGTLLNLGEGESYVWIIDSRFTTPPNDFTFEVGIERLYFDLVETGNDFFGLIMAALLDPLGTLDPPDESGITFASISAPYSLRFENPGQDECSQSYNTSELYTKSSLDITCGVSAGFGYIHYSPPDDNSNRRMWELAYIEARFHPHAESKRLPREAELVVRTDSVLPTSGGMEGEKSLTTLEYWADRRSDLHIHFHEDRSDLPESESDGTYGNTTDSMGWLRGMPSGTLEPEEIQRAFRMLGSADQPELPGDIPTQLGLIIGIKNFTRDNSQNVDDPTLPVNPADPPESLIVVRSNEPLQELDYTSWFSRGGKSEDHRRVHIFADSIPSAVAVYGSFGLGGSAESNDSLDSGANLDFISKIVDSVILNLVDVFLDVGSILNEVPSTIVNLIGGSVDAGGLSGREMHLLMTDTWLASRIPFPLDELSMQIGSSDHVTSSGNHVILSRDIGLGQMQTDQGLVDPLVPIAASINFSGLQAFSLIDSNTTETQEFNLKTVSDEGLRLSYVSHETSSLNDSKYQSAWLSDVPDNITISVSQTGVDYSASSEIGSIVYTGFDGSHSQAVRISGFPDSFSTTSGNVLSWSSDSAIDLIEAQLTDASEPLSMEGDHFLFHHDPLSNTSSLSATLTGVSEVGWIPPLEGGAPGPDGIGTAFATIEGRNAMRINIANAPSSEQLPLNVLAEIDPLPSSLSVQIPSGSEAGPSLDIPEFNSSQGMTGVAFFIGGFSDLGRSVNGVLSGITTDISTGSSSGDGNFSFSLGLEADSNFDLVVESYMGSDSMEEPEWVHGIVLNSATTGITDGFHLKTWIPNLPPLVDISLSREMITSGEVWSVTIGLEGWEPFNPEFVIASKGVNGQDIFLTIDGLEVGSPTSLLVESVFRTETVGGITETSTSTLYSMSNRLDWFHALLLDRQAGSRTEMMVQDIPESVEIQASLGNAVSMDVTVPEQFRQGDLGVGSIMIQQMQWLDGSWWPATLFLTQVPGSMNLTTEPDLNFDITKNLAFQGMPILDFSASSEGMSLYIEAQGRAINSKGDVVLLAEGLADRLSIKPTDSFGLNIRSSGDGVDRLYFRATDMPTLPPVVLDQIEAMGENLKSANIKIHEFGRVTVMIPGYQLIEVADVQGGRIIISARASAEVNGIDVDLRGVVLDAQITGGVPSGTTLGVNGFASDLSLLNKIPGFSGSTSHWMAPEPMSSGILTLVATVGGMS